MADRSVEMEDAQYWLARWLHENGNEVPGVLRAANQKRAILVFYPACKDGRDEEQFYRVFTSGMNTFRRHMRDPGRLGPQQQETVDRAADHSLADLWNSLRDRCRLQHLPSFDVSSSASPVPVRPTTTAAEPAEPGLAPMAGADAAPESADNRNWTLRLIADRRGQTGFRDKLFDRFDRKCVITGCNLADVLEATHIKPYAGEPGDQDADNGLLLRADLHTLFDLHLLGVHPDTLAVEWHPRLSANTHYRSLLERPRTIPTPGGTRPRAEALRVRYAQFRDQIGRPELDDRLP